MIAITMAQAATLAVKLRADGMKNKEIARSLARAGYVSNRTGKPISASSVSGIIGKAKSGYVFSNNKARKYAQAHLRFQKRTKRIESGLMAKTLGPLEPVLESLHVEPHCMAIHDERVARAVMKKAIEKILVTLFGVRVVVSLPLDLAFRVTHS